MRHGGRDLVDLVIPQRAAVEQELAVAHDADDGRIADAERRRERLLDRACEALDLRERQRATADPRDRLLDGAADKGSEPFRPRAHGSAVLAQHPQHGDPFRRVEIETQRSLECRERELVRADGAV